jgi:integrative and conjugative element protein (TIGR02256 family)
MELINKHKHAKLIIQDSLLEKLGQLGMQSYPNECGGFLLGYYSKDFLTLHITDLLLPKKQKKSSYSFERSVDGLKIFFNKLLISKKYYYIGEWHTHPNGSSMFSQTDLKAMIEIVSCDTVNITNPILLILAIDYTKVKDFSIYIYDNKGLYRYE